MLRFSYNSKQKFKKILIFLILLVILVVINKNNQFSNQKANNKTDELFVKIFDLGSKLDPNETYFSIKCRKSMKIIVSTTLCIHDLNNDVYVSNSIWNDGIWEKNILGKIIILIINFYLVF